MRKVNDDRLLLSASDLMRFMGCAHAAALDLAYLHGEGPLPRADTEDAALLQKQGDAHEAAHLAKLKASGVTVVEMERSTLADNAKETRATLANGPQIVFQGAFLGDNWGGWADFLERVERPSDLGAFSYEVTDTKLKRRLDPKHVLQLALYSDLLSEIQGLDPEFAYVELGDGRRAPLRLADYQAYARMARQRLEGFLKNPPPTRPIPCADCALCRWSDDCESQWQATDSLFNIANITGAQVKKLEAAGVTTMEELAGLEHPVRGMGNATLARLVTQARLQHARKSGAPTYEYREAEAGKGFDLLPAPVEGDIFYDIEGDPHYEGGLEYLHGVWFDGQFQPFWAHDHDAEARALYDLFEFFKQRLTAYPAARIYHYAPYEITALRRLTAKYGVGEAFLDRLLRERRFVDLFAVVRGALIGSESNYSIKSMEAFYGRVREGEVKTAGGSIIAYERWRETEEQNILDEIEDYNCIDCISTQELRDWLVTIRPEAPWPALLPDASEKESDEDAETQALRARLASSGLSQERQQLLFNLGQFHKREAKPAQWAVFDSASKDEDELIDDLDALAGLEAIGPAAPVKRSVLRRYRFPLQETKLRAGRRATVAVVDKPPASVSIEEFDSKRRIIAIKVVAAKAHLLSDRLTLHPNWPLNTDVLAAAVQDVIDDQCSARRLSAIDDMLGRAAPRLTTGSSTDLLNGSDILTGTIAAIAAMDGTVLPVQGPPGTGKTYVTARAILDLVRKGYRVGVASNSHEAIRNVLMGCLAAQEDGDPIPDLCIGHKVSSGADGYPDDCDGIIRSIDNAAPLWEYAHILGGTAFFFARPEREQTLDWLFVDEAGQVGLANMVAMGRCARNIVLVGDPRQLPQVIQGAHPEPANLSCLEWMLGEHATIPPDRGIFLPVSRRMHPDVCKFISQQVYEGRLDNSFDTAIQAVGGTSFPRAGSFWVPVVHEGNAQSAAEEIAAIHKAIDELLSGSWTDKYAETRALSPNDIIVVAPYNAQVNALQDALPTGIRIGTVDKFQGQEAPICLVSMTASSVEETPRGMDFLFSLNRINVAVSRAKGLALVFGSPRLREAKCNTVEQMRLVNTLCALPEFGGV
jgi:predicted RecB family nuclease